MGQIKKTRPTFCGLTPGFKNMTFGVNGCLYLSALPDLMGDPCWWVLYLYTVSVLRGGGLSLLLYRSVTASVMLPLDRSC